MTPAVPFEAEMVARIAKPEILQPTSIFSIKLLLASSNAQNFLAARPP